MTKSKYEFKASYHNYVTLKLVGTSLYPLDDEVLDTWTFDTLQSCHRWLLVNGAKEKFERSLGNRYVSADATDTYENLKFEIYEKALTFIEEVTPPKDVPTTEEKKSYLEWMHVRVEELLVENSSYSSANTIHLNELTRLRDQRETLKLINEGNSTDYRRLSRHHSALKDELAQLKSSIKELLS